MVATRTRAKTGKLLNLFERIAPQGAARLKLDREKGIVYGVKVGGRFSPNTHGVKDVTGTEYTRACYESALPLYEGARVRCDHPDRQSPDQERSVYESLGVLRNCRVEDREGEYGLYADLHMTPSDPMAQKVMDDVEQGLGLYGLSHNAEWEKAEPRGGRFVIERLGRVRGVDLVDKPATNKNLWESQETTVKYTLKSILESRAKKLSAPRIAWSKRLLEMDDLPVDAETPDMPAETDPDEALAAGFRAALNAVLDDDSMDTPSKLKKIKDLLTTQDKLTQSEEPEAPVEESDSEDDSEDKGKDKKKPADAAESLKELAQLKAEKACRKLCESEKYTAPTELQLKTLSLLESDQERRQLIRDYKAAAAAKTQAGTPRSGLPGKTTLESEGGIPQTTEGQLAFLRRGH